MFFNETQRLLELVSRSFALCIPKLPKKVRAEIGNFYLLCRYADSIEDSSMPYRKKRIFFNRLIRALKKNDSKLLNELNADVLPWIENENDCQLVKEFKKVLQTFQTFDKKSKRIAISWLREMTKGMLKYSKKEIENFLDLDKYCYYVAGTVGMYVTEILDYKFNLHKFDELKARAKDFGLLLQKVNIIKDFAKDVMQGRIYWPKELFQKYQVNQKEIFDEKNKNNNQQMLEEMIKSTEQHIKNSIEYLERLPKELQLACAMPFFLAIPTLLKCYGNAEIFDYTKKVKISRQQTMEIICTIEKNAGKELFPTHYFFDLNKKNEHGFKLEIK